MHLENDLPFEPRAKQIVAHFLHVVSRRAIIYIERYTQLKRCTFSAQIICLASRALGPGITTSAAGFTAGVSN